MVRSLGGAREQVTCWIDGQRLSSFPDTGAQVNLLSTRFAASLQGRIDRDQSITIELADGSSRKTDGTIEVTISFCEPASCTGPIHVLENSKTGKSRAGSVSMATSRIKETFHVLNGLTFDVILGETLLSSVDAYVNHKNNFSLLTIGLPQLLAPTRIKRRGEGSRSQRPALTPRQALDNDFQAEQSRYQAQLDDIEARLTRGYGFVELSTARLQVDASHMLWWTTNRPRLEEHYTAAWYEENVPKLST
ncbi:hypothetical protein EG329_007010 [Mollisiaceae sp. DMI_Dod_QoI]|nr:hypothetical protein EG329_007010 [Helotiales sp. DMI_Dod_QoI]